eukprot:5884285-Amphidinium_carterae.3
MSSAAPVQQVEEATSQVGRRKKQYATDLCEDSLRQKPARRLSSGAPLAMKRIQAGNSLQVWRSFQYHRRVQTLRGHCELNYRKFFHSSYRRRALDMPISPRWTCSTSPFHVSPPADFNALCMWLDDLLSRLKTAKQLSTMLNVGKAWMAIQQAVLTLLQLLQQATLSSVRSA